MSPPPLIPTLPLNIALVAEILNQAAPLKTELTPPEVAAPNQISFPVVIPIPAPI